MEIGACLRDVSEWSRCPDDITEPLDRQSDQPCAYHCPGRNWKKEVRLPRLAAAFAYRNRELVQSPASLALERIQKSRSTPLNRTWSGMK